MKFFPSARLRSFTTLGVLAAGGVGLALGIGRQRIRPFAAATPSRAPAAPVAPASPGSADEARELPSLVTFDKARQASAGVRTSAVGYAGTEETLLVTGKIALDEDRLAHVASMVDGVLREVRVPIGAEVAAGQVLARVDSQEVGAAKLQLVRDRMEVAFARTNHQWSETIHKNTQALITALGASPAVVDLEKTFRGRPMGDNRQLLVAGYARFRQAQADFDRLDTLHRQQVGVEKDYLRARAELESAAATHQAALEQLKFTTGRERHEAEQELQQAITAQRMSRAALLILGYTESEIDQLDPLAEGAGMAHYPIRAPFAGTVIGKHAVLSEQVGPQHQLFAVADLSRVWLQADVFEKDLALLARSTGKTIRFHTAGYPDRTFNAQIVHTGSAVDEKTRAVRLLAAADNRERLLKPGMFVEVSIPLSSPGKALQVPAAAVQSTAGEAYVFVARGPEEFQRRVIHPGRTLGKNIEVRDGLRPDETIVVDGVFALKSELLKDQLSD